ncbi:ribosomal RNA-processing protein 7-domain-containing protein [Powellomyces hirtus]|nr:ribosomal RNA-processing protein 7-domain-containing protein [Powellomyces hirtus]
MARKHTKQQKPKVAAAEPSSPAPAAPPPSSTPLRLFGAFRILPLTLPPLPLSTHPLTQFTHHQHRPPTTATAVPAHHLFIRAHEPRKPQAGFPQGRTLFVANVPSDANEMHFARLFRRCGVVERVVWGGGNASGPLLSVRRTGGTAHVVFVDEDAVERAVGMKERRRVWSDQVDNDNDDGEAAAQQHAEDDGEQPTPVTTPLHGLAKYLHLHYSSRPRLATLQSATDTTLAAFEDAERAARLAVEQSRNVPDQDGFVTVVRGKGRRGMNVDGQGAAVMAAKAEDVTNLKPKKKKELVDFYRFQMRENKRNQLADLRRKFEDDKQKIVALRASRRFKPY